MKITAREMAAVKTAQQTEKTYSKDTYHNGRWARLRALARHNGITDNALKMRLYKYKWDETRAVTEPLGTNVGNPKKDGHKHGDYARRLAQAKANGIKKSTYDSRVYMYGWDEERAATEPVGSSTGRPKAK